MAKAKPASKPKPSDDKFTWKPGDIEVTKPAPKPKSTSPKARVKK